MKTSSLTVFCISIILCSLTNSIQLEAMSHDAPLRGYFYVQRLYPGKDPIDNVKQSEFAPRQVFLEVNKELVFISKSFEQLEDVEDSIYIHQLHDPKIDDLSSGKCCSRVAYHEYPGEKGLKSILAFTAHNTPNGAPVVKRGVVCRNNCGSSSMDSVSKPRNLMANNNPKDISNFCLILFVPDEARWKICHENQDTISKLQMKIIFNIIAHKHSTTLSNIPNFIANAHIGRESPMKPWEWQNQETWGGICSRTYMQSPVNISTGNSQKDDINFSIRYSLLPVHTLIKRNGKEVVVAFTNYGGILQLAIGPTYILFTPTYLSFRFPGEHLINGQRTLGEILLHFDELSEQRKTATTNGLVINIPINRSNDESNFEPFEQLNIDYWKYEIEKHGTYLPKQFLKKKLLIFNISELIEKVSSRKPNYQFYFGSHSSPPCMEHTYHLVVDKPVIISSCQFKLLRANTLISNKAVEIHARMEQGGNDRPVYSFSSSQVKKVPRLIQITPQSFNKYLVVHGYGYKCKDGQCRDKKKTGKDQGTAGEFGKLAKANEMNCDLSNELKKINDE